MTRGAKEHIRVFYSSLSEDRVLDVLSILIAAKYEAPIGRPRLARLLGIGERRIRNLINLLKKRGFISQTRGGIMLSTSGLRLLEDVYFNETTRGFTCCLLAGGEFTSIVRENVVSIRDWITISLADPQALILIAILEDVLYAPGVPGRVLQHYLEEFNGCNSRPGAAALFEKPKCYRCCAALVHAVLKASSLIANSF
ncbi:MAG: hypothetical protein DSY37_04700 [Hyperthermus sp.]|nr:MAG: hypothetical protein DSY37_04700 [Hyperthermus sp.]